ncbi:MAG TPA: molybdopterin-binding/glycosyltransferase family 2 protein [Stellaceae bacterium]|jgi:molybdenum cofactor cytidylyltransferase|nr:molybdopterin-binding/glycosyltransferase family 2 protein [Stellaceae bacterium]
MKFGAIPVAKCAGAILAHSLKTPKGVLKKGRVLSAADAEALAAAGLRTVIAARLEPGDVGENDAATELAKATAGDGVRVAGAFTGRANLFATVHGLAVIDRASIDQFNRVDETLTLATVEPYAVVAPDQMIATLKVIPFAVSRSAVDKCLAVAREAPLLRIAPLRAKRAALIQTRLTGLKETILDKTAATTRERLAALGSSLVHERRCDHTAEALAPEITLAIRAGADLVLIAGASAIVDRRDVIPAAIAAAGGAIEHFGMPVDPGNLMLMGRLGSAPVLGLPGCARSPKVNGFDWVLQRLLADLPAGPREIMGMGVGGLLADIPTRPLPRALATQEAGTRPTPPRTPHVGALVLAAGQSRRMGTLNKLLIEIDGVPMVRRVVEMLRQSKVDPIVVVTGHEHERIAAALKDLGVTLAHNPEFAQGLSTSLKAGIAALSGDVDGALVCLGDMPRVTAAEVDRLIGAFNPVEGRGIVVPTLNGKRGNPVLWSKRFFPEMSQVAGDVGARHLIGAYPEMVAEVEMAGDGVLTDIDTPQALAKLAASGVKITA